MSKLPPPLAILIISKKKVVAQGRAIVMSDEVAITSLTTGDNWLQDWGNLSRGTSIEVAIATNDKNKTTLIEGFMSLHYWSEGTHNPHSQGLEQFVAILRKSKPYSGTTAYKLWQAAQAGDPSWYGEECFIYSDVSFSGELRNIGPFNILNNNPQEASTMASLTLRYTLYQRINDFGYTFQNLPYTHPNQAGYRERTHISIAEEIASLIQSLRVGGLSENTTSQDGSINQRINLETRAILDQHPTFNPIDIDRIFPITFLETSTTCRSSSPS